MSNDIQKIQESPRQAPGALPKAPERIRSSILSANAALLRVLAFVCTFLALVCCVMAQTVAWLGERHDLVEFYGFMCPVCLVSAGIFAIWSRRA